MLFGSCVKIEQAMTSSQSTVFFDLLADKLSNKEAKKSQTTTKIACATYKQLFTEISFETFSYVAEETSRKAKNMVSYLK